MAKGSEEGDVLDGQWIEAKLPNDEALLAGIVYVAKKQPNPLAVYVSEEWQEIIAVINPE